MVSTRNPGQLRLVCISDTLNEDPTPYVPDGDILLHAGDLTKKGTFDELIAALRWLRALPHTLKVVIPGEKDSLFDPEHEINYNQLLKEHVTTDPAIQADGVIFILNPFPRSCFNNRVVIFGHPYIPRTSEMTPEEDAFTYAPYPDAEAEQTWEAVPKQGTASKRPGPRPVPPISIWLTHGPPNGHLDENSTGQSTGCEEQRRQVISEKPLLCVFGHCYNSYGLERVVWKAGSSDPRDDCIEKRKNVTDKKVDGIYNFTKLKNGSETLFVNASLGRPGISEKRNDPIVIDLQLPI